jgi:hypothetical protein
MNICGPIITLWPPLCSHGLCGMAPPSSVPRVDTCGCGYEGADKISRKILFYLESGKHVRAGQASLEAGNREGKLPGSTQSGSQAATLSIDRLGEGLGFERIVDRVRSKLLLQVCPDFLMPYFTRFDDYCIPETIYAAHCQIEI